MMKSLRENIQGLLLPVTKRMTGMYGEEKESKVIIFPVVQKENSKVIKDGEHSIILFFNH